MINKKKLSSPILIKYLKLYEKNPNSRVFAPLADVYRKLGLFDQAMEILKKGIHKHPNYSLGYLIMGNCYFDLKKYDLAYKTLRPLINKNLENILMQKIFAQTCLELGKKGEALDTYKYLLFLKPKDEFFKEKVRILETSSEEGEVIIGRMSEISGSQSGNSEFTIPESISYFNEGQRCGDEANEIRKSSQEDQWEEIRLFDQNQQNCPLTYDKIQSDVNSNEDQVALDGWNLKTCSKKFEIDDFIENVPMGNEESRNGQKGLNDDLSLQPDIREDSHKKLITEIFENEEERGNITKNKNNNSNEVEYKIEKVLKKDEKSHELEEKIPVATHTLVDLYCAQGYYRKGCEILEKILILNPGDVRTSERLNQLKEILRNRPGDSVGMKNFQEEKSEFIGPKEVQELGQNESGKLFEFKAKSPAALNSTDSVRSLDLANNGELNDGALEMEEEYKQIKRQYLLFLSKIKSQSRDFFSTFSLPDS